MNLRTLRPVPVALLAGAVTALLALAGCGAGGSTGDPAASGASGAGAATVPVRVGYFPNLTHAPGLVADAEGFFTRRIGAGKVSINSFNAGPEVLQALLGGSLDISYIGPSPTVTAYAQSQGQAIRVIAGSTSGGASLVVKPGIHTAADLRGKKLSTPQLGNTQDVALRYYLSSNGLKTTPEGGGDVAILPQKNSATVQAFGTGQIDGAWVPEPFASQLVAKGGVVLVDERDLWPSGKFVTTNVVVRTEFLTEHPETVKAFLQAHLDALQLIKDDPAKAQADVAAKIKAITGQDTAPALIAAAWPHLDFTADPLAATLKAAAAHADSLGLLDPKPADDFAKLWDLAPLDGLLAARNLPTIAP